MHHALEIQEILLHIFQHVFTPPLCISDSVEPGARHGNTDMVSLAVTCRAFKEPALDILWSVVGSLSSLWQFAPEVSPGSMITESHTQEQWKTLQSYTRRIHEIHMLTLRPGRFFLPNYGNHTSQALLFPNLRKVSVWVHSDFPPWLRHQYVPSLDSIHVTKLEPLHGTELCFMRDVVSMSEFYPNLTKISLRSRIREISTKPRAANPYMWPWKNLQILDCPGFTLQAEDLIHLTRLSALDKLAFALSNADDVIHTLGLEPLVFANLKYLEFSIGSRTLESISRFLAHVRFPAVEKLVVNADDCSPGGFDIFVSNVEAACINQSVIHLELINQAVIHPLDVSWFHLDFLRQQPDPRVGQITGLECLAARMAFTNIHQLSINITAHIQLTDNTLLELTSAWPLLECLQINIAIGWNSHGSVYGYITPNGIHQLLQQCPLLEEIGLVIQMSDPTSEATAHLPVVSPSPRLMERRKLHINVIDSVIDESSVPSMASLLAGIVRPYDTFRLTAWRAFGCRYYPFDEQVKYERLWGNVELCMNEILNAAEGHDGNRE